MSKAELDSYKPEFHRTGAAYILPKDSTEQQRLAAQHEAWKALMHGKILHAPVQAPRKIVDVGCGTGAVSRLLASTFPTAQVYGIDLSVLPTQTSLPNLSYIHGDVRRLLSGEAVHGVAGNGVASDGAASHREAGHGEDGHGEAGHGEASAAPQSSGDPRLAPGTVDYAFQRLLVLGMTDWPGYVAALASSVRSGGWVEIHEWDFEVSEDGAGVCRDWPWLLEMVRSAWETKRLDLRCSQKLAGWMRDAGLVDVRTVSYRAPLGTWDCDEHPESRVMAEYLARWWPAFNWLCIPALMAGADSAYVDGLKAQMLGSLERAQREQRRSYEIVVCYGRKP